MKIMTSLFIIGSCILIHYSSKYAKYFIFNVAFVVSGRLQGWLTALFSERDYGTYFEQMERSLFALYLQVSIICLEFFFLAKFRNK